MSGIIYTPPAGAGIIPDLDQVMNVGNTTTVPYIGTGIGLMRKVITGPTVYTPATDDFLLLCDIGAGNVTIELDPLLTNLYAIKLINFTAGNHIDITVLSGGRIDGQTQYRLTRNHGSILVQSRKNTTDYIVIASNDALGSVNSGRYTAGSFVGSTLTIPHTFNAIPTGVTILPGNFDGLSLLSNPYFVTVNSTDITIDFTAPVAMPNPFVIFWTVTRN